jgi:hypothetical protein
MEKKRFEYKDLPKELQEDVISFYADSTTDHDWHDMVIEGFKEDMKEIGVEVDKVQFSGFWSQGDGASFTGEVTDLEEFLTKTGMNKNSNLTIDLIEAKELSNEIQDFDSPYDQPIYIIFRRISHHYSHENTCDTDVSGDLGGEDTFIMSELGGCDGFTMSIKVSDFLSTLEEMIEKWREKTCNKLYRDLEKEYDYLTSEEGIVDYIDALGIDFECEVDEEGNPTSILEYQ